MIKKILLTALSINSLAGLIVFLWGVIELVKKPYENPSIGQIIGSFFIFVTVFPIGVVIMLLNIYLESLIYDIKKKIKFA